MSVTFELFGILLGVLSSIACLVSLFLKEWFYLNIPNGNGLTSAFIGPFLNCTMMDDRAELCDCFGAFDSLPDYIWLTQALTLCGEMVWIIFYVVIGVGCLKAVSRSTRCFIGCFGPLVGGSLFLTGSAIFAIHVLDKDVYYGAGILTALCGSCTGLFAAFFRISFECTITPTIVVQ